MTGRAAQSVFLNRAPRRQDYLNRVLVVGGDETGREIARRLVGEGFDVLLLCCAKDWDADTPGVNVLSGTLLDRVEGFVGGFTVTLVGPNGPIDEHVGFIISTPPAEAVSRVGQYGLKQTERTVSLTDLEALLEQPDRLPARRGEWFHVAFLLGLERESEPAILSRALSCIEQLGNLPNTQCYAFVRHLKVAADDLERRYRECREKGTIFFKFDGPGPRFLEDADGLHMIFVEPLLAEEVELLPDMVVVDEDLRPPRFLTPLLDTMPSSELLSPFLQPDSPRFPGVITPKAGILAVGPSRGVFDADLIAGDIESVVLAVKEAQSPREDGTIPGPPQIDPARCTMCLTCVRLCPHGAITFQTAADVDPATCVRCGVCAAECPMRAIVLSPPAGKTDVRSEVKDRLACSEGPQKIVAFLCSRSGGQALEAYGPGLPESLVPVVVRCAGTVDLAHILEAFRYGADAVLVGGCFQGNCASLYGNVLGEQRVDQAQGFLRQAGIEPDRLKFVALAANTPGRLRETVDELAGFVAIRQ